MWDVVIAGGGPAGSVAAIILARAGARVLLVDRARFPRDKLCGDSLNPGALARLRRLRLSEWVETHGTPIRGMLVTGPGGVRVEGRYPDALTGRTVRRSDLDHYLLSEAARAGARVEEGVRVRGARVDQTGGALYATGVRVASRGGEIALPARVTIAADGRRSAIAFGLGLARHPPRPRRWAVGAYFDGVQGTSTVGEMHIRAGAYLGVAPIAGGLTNACLVTGRARLGSVAGPRTALRAAIDGDPELRARFVASRPVGRPIVLGPLAVETDGDSVKGLLLAGDAAGFIDPMTGDGLRFAIRGAELAAASALELLATGCLQTPLAQRRREAFGAKWRFNRALRRLIDAPAAVGGAAIAAAIAPAALRTVICFAGDCGESGH